MPRPEHSWTTFSSNLAFHALSDPILGSFSSIFGASRDALTLTNHAWAYMGAQIIKNHVFPLELLLGSLSPSLENPKSPERPPKSPSDPPETLPRRPQDHPETLQNPPRPPHDRPKSLQRSPKASPRASKTLPRHLKTLPRLPQDPLKTLPRRPPSLSFQL